MSDSNNNSNSQNSFLDSGKRKSKDSINGYTRAVRRKLYFLFLMLVLVIILMKEARKPERWMWMGFDTAPNANATFDLDAEQQNENSKPEFDHPTVAGLIPLATDQAIAEPNSDDFQSVSFWSAFWDGLEPEDQAGLVQLIEASQRTIEQRQIEPSDFEILADAIRSAKPDVNEAFEKTWNASIAPGLLALAENKDITIGQQRTIGKLFQTLDPIILSVLDDFSSPGMKSDLPAWYRYWGQILNQHRSTESTLVSPVQLVAQPKAWRFTPIRMQGMLVSGRSRTAKEFGPLGKSGQWYEWWIGNVHGSSELYCVYTATKPDSIEVADRFTELDIPIEVEGLFYKIRSYVDSQSKANHCPLILANSLSVNQPMNPIAAASWKPSTAVLVTSILGVMALAMVIAIAVYRSDRGGQRRHPGGKHKESIESHLRSLKDESEIKSPIEKLEELS